MSTFVELSLILMLATTVAGLMRLLRQPLIVGYILTGILVGPQALNIFASTETLSVFSEIGIAILLFIVGLHLNPKELKEYGSATLIVSLGQIIFTFMAGFLLARGLGFEAGVSLYIGLALTFSSTIVVLKLLTDKKELEKLYGKIAIGVLLLQDVVAAVALIVISTGSQEQTGGLQVLEIVIKGIILTIVLSLVAVRVLPRLSKFFAKSQEFLFLFSLAWGLGLATIFHELGFSVEIGALAAGVALALTPYSQEVSSRLKPLRDFFVVVFFVTLGAGINLGGLQNFAGTFLVFLAFIVLVKPVIIMGLSKIAGYTKKTGFLAGSTLAQISEFSIILVLMGLKTGHLDQATVSLITALTMGGILVSTYFINFSDKLYSLLTPLLRIFDNKESAEKVSSLTSYEVILFGCNRTGYDFIQTYRDLGMKFLAVDFDPETVAELTAEGVNCKYGDADDSDFLEEIGVEEAKLVISTIPEHEINMHLLKKVRTKNEDNTVILMSQDVTESLELYENGASYVILPHFLAGTYVAEIVRRGESGVKKMAKRREDHVEYLEERKRLGHSYPRYTQ